jgi:hypothetical protein
VSCVAWALSTATWLLIAGRPGTGLAIASLAFLLVAFTQLPWVPEGSWLSWSSRSFTAGRGSREGGRAP